MGGLTPQACSMCTGKIQQIAEIPDQAAGGCAKLELHPLEKLGSKLMWRAMRRAYQKVIPGALAVTQPFTRVLMTRMSSVREGANEQFRQIPGKTCVCGPDTSNRFPVQSGHS